eukprot:gene1041-4508_t
MRVLNSGKDTAHYYYGELTAGTPGAVVARIFRHAAHTTEPIQPQTRVTMPWAALHLRSALDHFGADVAFRTTTEAPAIHRSQPGHHGADERERALAAVLRAEAMDPARHASPVRRMAEATVAWMEGGTGELPDVLRFAADGSVAGRSTTVGVAGPAHPDHDAAYRVVEDVTSTAAEVEARRAAAYVVAMIVYDNTAAETMVAKARAGLGTARDITYARAATEAAAAELVAADIVTLTPTWQRSHTGGTSPEELANDRADRAAGRAHDATPFTPPPLHAHATNWAELIGDGIAVSAKPSRRLRQRFDDRITADGRARRPYAPQAHARGWVDASPLKAKSRGGLHPVAALNAAERHTIRILRACGWRHFACHPPLRGARSIDVPGHCLLCPQAADGAPPPVPWESHPLVAC